MRTLTKTKLGLKEPPRFETDAEGRSKAVTLDTPAYISLLVQASLTDPSLWPPGAKQGATALARIRKIESDCIAKYGEFDWERLRRRQCPSGRIRTSPPLAAACLMNEKGASRVFIRKLSESLQDEYDGLCILLDQLRDTGKRISLKAYLAKRSKKRP